ncbi:MAG: hypothetical protein JNM17_32040 [Archangium sp.]|nr:hypothetical protein [Archangium sp.]
MKRVLGVVGVVALALFVTRHAWLVNAGAALANYRAADKLTPVDRLTFEVPNGWAPIIRTDMDDAWKPLERRGFNSFVFGAPESIFSGGASREDPSALRYQAWFGVYSVILESPDDLALEERELVAFADSLLQDDQLRWLKTMGDPQPTATVVRREAAGTVKFLGRDVTLYEGEVETHSDLGEPITRAGRFLGRASEWDEKVTSHHPMTLEGFVAVARDAERKRLYVAWGNGVKFGDTRTWPKLREEILTMLGTARLDETK